MNNNTVRFLAIIAIVSFTVSCTTASPVTKGAAAGGAGGAVVGAGTGAIVASLISGGEVGSSALLGAAIGLPVGMVLGAMYVRSQQKTEIEINNLQIQDNHELLQNRQQEIELLRQKMLLDSRDVDPDVERREHLFQGPTLGNYYR